MMTDRGPPPPRRRLALSGGDEGPDNGNGGDPQMDRGTVETIEYVTAGGVRTIRTATRVDSGHKSDVLDGLVAAVGERRGGVLASGMEYPGRYSRWHMGYVDPCLEIVARGRRLTVRALNERGRVPLAAIAPAVGRTGEVTTSDPDLVEVFIPPTDELFAEEERS